MIVIGEAPQLLWEFFIATARASHTLIFMAEILLRLCHDVIGISTP
jgi:hypothetical protein